ncbi:hypothetical protein RhiirC2_794694 [Rhizophagus irregularis]|uniref:Uncharacterized protein n=1 Tax=Rhizophagus irregularis TaxID=588596 RepID=A0A2N1MD25_9GLOM|nr:hypothetical protein RhiirC2_794694 [Rhizophagus irregularis]
MGITPSREDFVALEGYAKKSEEEHREIIQNAGIEITENDKEIAQFLEDYKTATNDMIQQKTLEMNEWA